MTEIENQALHQAARDLSLAEAQLQAFGTLLAAASFAISDALRAKGRQTKAARKAAKEARTGR